jgi:hypothetical protein
MSHKRNIQTTDRSIDRTIIVKVQGHRPSSHPNPPKASRKMNNGIEKHQGPEYDYFHLLRGYLEQGFTTALRRKLPLWSALNHHSYGPPANSLADREPATPRIRRPLPISSDTKKAPSVKVEPQCSEFPETKPVQEQCDNHQDSMKRLGHSSRTTPINCDKDSRHVNKSDDRDIRKRRKMRTEDPPLRIVSATANPYDQGLDSDDVEAKRERSSTPSNGDFEFVENSSRLDDETRCPPHIAQSCKTCKQNGLEVSLSTPH